MYTHLVVVSPEVTTHVITFAIQCTGGVLKESKGFEPLSAINTDGFQDRCNNPSLPTFHKCINATKFNTINIHMCRPSSYPLYLLLYSVTEETSLSCNNVLLQLLAPSMKAYLQKQYHTLRVDSVIM